MAEIKSTLDLVMERTKNLRFSEEERQAQKAEDVKKALNGLIQQHLDQLIDKDELDARVAGLFKEFQIMDRSLLRDVILDKIDVEALAGPLPDLLAGLCQSDISGLKALAGSCTQALSNGREKIKAELMENLRARHGISGPAVEPNLDAGPGWQHEIRSRMAALEEDLVREKTKIAGTHL
jgi:hypothetical protein